MTMRVSVRNIKMDQELYNKRLHYLMTNTSEKTVWEALSNGTFDQLIENVPDEFYKLVLEWSDSLLVRFDEITSAALSDWDNTWCEGMDRKTFAQEALKSPHKDILFRIYDNRTYDDLIWKRLKP